MRAVVLVGGFGTRLRPLTLSVPKQMLPVCGRPMLERVVAQLAAAGVTEAVLSLGYRPERFIEAYPDGICAGITMTYAVEPEPLDTAGAIAYAARQAGIDETFLAVNGDVLTDIDLAGLVAQHRATGCAATIALTPVEDPSRYGVVATDGSGRVVEFVEKPPAGTAPSNWINAGLYVLDPTVLDDVTPGERCSIDRGIFPDLAARGALYARESHAYWVDAGTPAAYLQVHLDLQDGRRALQVDPLDATAVVHPTALVERSCVGSGARIAKGARVIESVILPGTLVGEGATIERSIVGAGAQVGAGAHLSGLSMVGFDRVVPAGTTLHGGYLPPEEDWV